MEKKSFPGTIDSLSPIRDYISDIARDAGFDKKAVYNLSLAVDEVAANIILYGYKYDEENNSDVAGNVDVSIELEDNCLSVTLEDDAEPYDPTEQSLPEMEDFDIPLEDRPIGGLGVFLAFTSVDEFKYEYVNNRNRNIFVINK